MRQLVTIRTIENLFPIQGADLIVAAQIGGWQCVVKKDDFQIGSTGIFFEIDSLISGTDERFKFLSKGKVQTHFRIKSIRLKGTLSQGLMMPMSILTQDEISRMESGENLADILGVVLYELPVPIAGKQKGTFPIHLVPKTDQERIQNMPRAIEDRSTSEFEVTEKVDGTSCTIWYHNQPNVVSCQDCDQLQLKRNPYVGVASRNWEMQRDDDNVYAKMLIKHNLVTKLGQLDRNIAIQGEIIGPGIQGNKYQLGTQEFFVFDIFDIDQKKYLPPWERLKLVGELGLLHVPIISGFDESLSMEYVLAIANGPSGFGSHIMREGLVFKALNSSLSFKAISNEWLLKNE